MRVLRSRWVRWVVPASAVLLLAAASHPIWLAAVGRHLVYEEQPIKAPVAVVLAGAWRGNRVLKAAELVRAGYAERVWVSGPPLYARSEADLAIEYAVGHGYPREWFVRLANEARSTWEEAEVITRELRRAGVRRYLLVTSDYHTRRARACFRRAAPEMEVRVVGAPDEEFPNPWWRHRVGWKTVVLEWLKTFAFGLGM